jgi:arsenate reductase
MAEGLVNHYLGDRVSAFSAGTDPTAVNPKAVAVMSEIGIDISHQYSKDADDFSEESFDYVITLLDEGGEKCLVHGAISYCGRCGEVCPHLEKTSHGGERLYLFGFPDPSKATGKDEKVMAEFRKTRDRIEAEIMRFFRTR